jgi:cytochrome c peroxidase
MHRSLLTILILAAASISISYIIGSCKKPTDIPDNAVQQEIPAAFPTPAYQFADNPLTSDGIELGRRLFYDGRLSVDGLHPCASCHQQIGSFGTFEHDRSHGVHDSHTLRNAPVLFNLAWNTSFHWDGEFVSLKEEAAQPITGHAEMGESFNAVIRKIETDVIYQRLFKKVFHSDIILPEYIQKALAQFTGSIISANSKYDRYKKGEVSFTTQEENGYQLYKANCATCHPEPMFTDYSFRNIGLPVTFLTDYGRWRITGKPEDSLKFKVPTLRNVYISSNYMHDGRFNTLAQCINHYRTGVQSSTTLDPLLVNGITLTNTQATELSLFLRALTDSSILKDPRWSAPQ